jgi:hypothetical protein
MYSKNKYTYIINVPKNEVSRKNKERGIQKT